MRNTNGVKTSVWRNRDGIVDKTAGEAITKVEEDRVKQIEEEKAERRFRKLLKTIWSITELAGFHIEGRIQLRDNRTGKLYD